LKFVLERKSATHFLSNKQKANWIQDYVWREAGSAKKQLGDAEIEIKQEKEHMSNAEDVVLAPRQPKIAIEEMLNAIRNSVSDLS